MLHDEGWVAGTCGTTAPVPPLAAAIADAIADALTPALTRADWAALAIFI